MTDTVFLFDCYDLILQTAGMTLILLDIKSFVCQSAYMCLAIEHPRWLIKYGTVSLCLTMTDGKLSRERWLRNHFLGHQKDSTAKLSFLEKEVQARMLLQTAEKEFRCGLQKLLRLYKYSQKTYRTGCSILTQRNSIDSVYDGDKRLFFVQR